MWGALAHRLVPLIPPYEINLKIYNYNDSPLYGHPFRGRVAISSGPSWSYSTTTLLKFYESGSLGGIGIGGNYSTLTWYSVRIQCFPSGKINYLIKQDSDGDPIEASSFTSNSIESYPYLTLESGGGSTYFDNIKIYYLGDASNRLKKDFNINSSEWIKENIPPGEIVQELYDPDK
jgi:hypothetical protein